MSIQKITITETEWKDGIRFEREKEYTRDEHRGDFDDFILEEMDDSDIRAYAQDELELIRKKDCPTTYVDDFDTQELIDELKERGFDVIECPTLSDSMKLEKLKELMAV